jgi:hypothetical protein
MLRLLIDENVDHRILRGLLRRVPQLDIFHYEQWLSTLASAAARTGRGVGRSSFVPCAARVPELVVLIQV